MKKNKKPKIDVTGRRIRSVKSKIKYYEKQVEHYKKKYENAAEWGSGEFHLREHYKRKYEHYLELLEHYFCLGILRQKQIRDQTLKRLKLRSKESLFCKTKLN